MKKLFSILVVLLSVLCFLGGEKGVLAESNSLETFRGYVNNDGKSSESRLGINNIYIDDNSQTILGYCFNIKKQYSSMYGDRYTKCTNVTAEQMKENSSSTLEDAVLYDSVMKVLYNGYPNNGSSIQQKYQLTDDQFRGITQLVIWKFTDSYTGYSFSSDNLENVYNELRNVSQLIYPYVQNFLAAEMLPENQTEYTSVSVKKVWDDSDDQDGQRSSEVTVQLLANGVEVSGQQLVLSDANGWNGTFENLDKYDSDNVLIDYTVKEVTDLSGYQSVISGSDNNYTITNTHVPEVINLSGTKTWDDNNNQDGKRPDSITVILLANGTEVASQEVTLVLFIKQKKLKHSIS